jgi:hypothetical protein
MKGTRKESLPCPKSPAIPGVQVVKVYSEDGACRSVEVAAGTTAHHVCEMLVQRAHALSDESWGLVECHPHLALGESECRELRATGGNVSHFGPGVWLIQEVWLISTNPYFLPLTSERGLEDHEFVVEVQAAWPVGGDSRFVFRKNFAKYELFKSSPVSV